MYGAYTAHFVDIVALREAPNDETSNVTDAAFSVLKDAFIEGQSTDTIGITDSPFAQIQLIAAVDETIGLSDVINALGPNSEKSDTVALSDDAFGVVALIVNQGSSGFGGFYRRRR